MRFFGGAGTGSRRVPVHAFVQSASEILRFVRHSERSEESRVS